jgi:hypothetical protein
MDGQLIWIHPPTRQAWRIKEDTVSAIGTTPSLSLTTTQHTCEVCFALTFCLSRARRRSLLRPFNPGGADRRGVDLPDIVGMTKFGGDDLAYQPIVNGVMRVLSQ